MRFQPKEGQIFERFYQRRRIVFVVTGKKTKGTGLYYIIKTDGTVGSRWTEDFELYSLIAEYPTWREAVNSEEFRE